MNHQFSVKSVMGSFTGMSSRSDRPWKSCRAFTLIELAVVVAVIAMLAMLLIPALAGAKAGDLRMQCQSNMRKLGTGFRLYEQDHNDMFPPAAVQGAGWTIAWDTYIHRYIGGTAPDSFLTQSVIPVEMTPQVERCPGDTLGKISWMTWGGGRLIDGVRSYAPVSCGSVYSTQVMVNAQGGVYPLPPISLGTGIYWAGSVPSSADWNPKSYRTSVVKDMAGSILLVEEPNAQGPAGNSWPSICIGPAGTGSWAAFYQVDSSATPSSSPTNANQGWHTYQLHGGRFNYLFHDNHVEALKIGQTLGTGTTNDPEGMWTVAGGD